MIVGRCMRTTIFGIRNVSLLNEARDNAENLLDDLNALGQDKKLRTHIAVMPVRTI